MGYLVLCGLCRIVQTKGNLSIAKCRLLLHGNLCIHTIFYSEENTTITITKYNLSATSNQTNLPESIVLKSLRIDNYDASNETNRIKNVIRDFIAESGKVKALSQSEYVVNWHWFRGPIKMKRKSSTVSNNSNENKNSNSVDSFVKYEIAMQYMDMDLKRYAKKISEEKMFITLKQFVNFIIRNMVQAIKHCHDCGYVHCDIKLQNFLANVKYKKSKRALKSGGYPVIRCVKLADFGAARKIENGKNVPIKALTQITPNYVGMLCMFVCSFTSLSKASSNEWNVFYFCGTILFACFFFFFFDCGCLWIDFGLTTPLFVGILSVVTFFLRHFLHF